MEFITTDTIKGLIFVVVGVLLFDQRHMLELMSSLSLCVVGTCNILIGYFSKLFGDQDQAENESLLSYYEKEAMDV